VPIVDFDTDTATCVGNDEDGCYYQVELGPDGWYVTLEVKSEYYGWGEGGETDIGPFLRKEDATQYGHNKAVEWCIDHGVLIESNEFY